MSTPLVVGVDVHRKTNTICLMDAQGHEVAPRATVANNRPGTQTFINQVTQRLSTGAFDGLRVAAEATGWEPRRTAIFAFKGPLDPEAVAGRALPVQSPADRQLQEDLRRPGSCRSHRCLRRRRSPALRPGPPSAVPL